MARITLTVLVAIMCFGLISADSKTPGTNMEELDKNLIESSNRFGFNLLREIVSGEEHDKNIFVSPLSVAYALTMTLNGANGETYNAIASTLELTDMSLADINSSFKNLTFRLSKLDAAVNFNIANSIWYRSGLPVDADFIKVNRDYFAAIVRGLDFGAPSAAADINNWVGENTNGKIERIINPPIDPSTIMLLINAIYFKGSWATQFEPAATKDHPFYSGGGRETTCRMMFNTDNFDYMENDQFQAIYLPYGEMGFGMVIFLPQSSVSVDDLIKGLDAAGWAIQQKSFYNTKVKLGLPRFKFEFDITLNDILESMGVAVAFDSQKADFGKMLKGGMIPEHNIYIDQVKHKTFLQVDEEGTEAAAVTSVTMALTSAAPIEPTEMIIDRPFLFTIQEKSSGSIVFIGRITDPVWQE